jgi:NAD/NADP transhydrogenase beta subunit
VDLHHRLHGLAGGRRGLRSRPPPDELAGHGPQRQPPERRGHDGGRPHDPALPATREGGLKVEALAIIVVGIVVGGGAGLYSAKTVKMTAMPQLVSLFNAVGGGAAAIVAIDDFLRVAGTPEMTLSTAIFVVLGVVIGCITFTGSLVASGKLQGLAITPSKPVMIPGGQLVTAALALVALAAREARRHAGGASS